MDGASTNAEQANSFQQDELKHTATVHLKKYYDEKLCNYAVCDLRDPKAIRATMKQAAEFLGGMIDVLVNNGLVQTTAIIAVPASNTLRGQWNSIAKVEGWGNLQGRRDSRPMERLHRDELDCSVRMQPSLCALHDQSCGS